MPDVQPGRPASARQYVAGLDLAGQAVNPGLAGWDPATRRDPTVLTPGRTRPGAYGLTLEIVHHEVFAGLRPDILVPRLAELIRHWRPEAVAAELGRRVRPLVFTAARKSGLAAELIAAVKAGRLKVYADASAERAEFLREFALGRRTARPGGYLEVAVDPAEGHDDFVISAGLAVEVAGEFRPRRARGFAGPDAGPAQL